MQGMAERLYMFRRDIRVLGESRFSKLNGGK